jgi:outer membrane murein-binding lipoprotein Lpp
MWSMSALTALLALGLFTALSWRLVRRVRALSGEVAALTERVHELSARLEAAEQDASSALAQADVAESVLLDKGVADEEDLEAARARSGAPEAPVHVVRPRDGDLH